jgi:hypothetical protein
MNDHCDAVMEKLTLYASGDLAPAEASEVEQHLDQCDACRSEHDSLQTMLGALDHRLFYPQEHEVDWDRFAAETAGLATGKVVPMRRRFLRPMHLARAAAVILAVGVGWVVIQNVDSGKVGPNAINQAGDPADAAGPGGKGARADDNATVMPVDFQRRVEVNMAREDARQYLSESRTVLLAVLGSPVRCEKDELDISLERRKSLELLRRKQFLRDDLDRPELARAAELCNRLEGILTEISTLDNCADLATIRELRDAVKRNQLLVKIGVAEKELGGKSV